MLLPLLFLTLVVPPAPEARISDYAGLLAPGDRARLEQRLTEHERATGTQMAIAIFPGLEGESLEDFSIRLAQKWRIGRKGLDNGVILLVFARDRKVRMEVGYGLEAQIPDSVAAQIIRESLGPRFRERRYAEGLEAAADAVYARIAPGTVPPPPPPRRRQDTSGLYALFFAVLVVGVIGWLALDAARQRGGYAARGRGWGSSGPGGPWVGGGSSGGGSSDGGFSGGGGGFGGGGASGDW